MRFDRAATAILVAVAVGAAACGNGSGKSTVTPAGAASVTGAASATAVVTPPPTATAAAPTPPPVATSVQPGATAVASVGVATAVASTVQPSTPGPPPTPKILTSPVAVTLDDDGGTVTMHVGEQFLLNLGDDIYEWSDVQVSDQLVLGRVVNITVVRGAQGVYEARAAGRVMLTATGDPKCRSSVPACALPSRLFHIDVAVS